MPNPTITYCFDDAVRHVAAWSGLDEKCVWQVLDAKVRYLELAGISKVKEDDALRQEREAIRHLLPRVSNLLDEGETRYIALMTKVEESTIQKVMDGDWDYLRFIGVVRNDPSEKTWPTHAPHPATLFRWREVYIPWTGENFGKLVYACPKGRRPASITSEEWGAQLLRALIDLHKMEVGYISEGYSRPWVLAQGLSARRINLLPMSATWNTWWGWDQLVITGTFCPGLPSEEEASWRRDGVLDRVIHLRNTYSDQDNSADTPGDDFARIFDTLKLGRSVLMFGAEGKPSGFIPSVISMLADPECHIAKVVYPIRQNFHFSQLEIGYLAGLWDARRLRRLDVESEPKCQENEF